MKNIFAALRRRAERLLFTGIMQWHLAKLARYSRPFSVSRLNGHYTIIDAKGTVCLGIEDSIAWALNGITATATDPNTKKDEEQHEENRMAHRRVPLFDDCDHLFRRMVRPRSD